MNYYGFMQYLMEQLIEESKLSLLQGDEQFADIFEGVAEILHRIAEITKPEMKDLMSKKQCAHEIGGFTARDVVLGETKHITIKICNYGLTRFDPRDNTIYVTMKNILDDPRPENVLHLLVHEAGHAIGGRSSPEVYAKCIKQYFSPLVVLQNYLRERKNSIEGFSQHELENSEEYKRATKKYRSSNEEFDAVGTDIATTFLKLYTSSGRKENVEILRQWISKGGDVNNIPPFLSHLKDYILTWKSKPTLYRRFLNRLCDLITKEFDMDIEQMSNFLLGNDCTWKNASTLTKWLLSRGNVGNIPDCLAEWKEKILDWSGNALLYKTFLEIVGGMVMKMRKKLLVWS